MLKKFWFKIRFMLLKNRKRVFMLVLVFLLISLEISMKFSDSLKDFKFNLGFLGISYFKNPNLLFSFDLGGLLNILVPVVCLCAIGIIFFSKTIRSLEKQVLGVIFIAGLLNFSERLLRGFVTDYIRIGDGYFNLADLLIFSGTVYLILNQTSWYRELKHRL